MSPYVDLFAPAKLLLCVFREASMVLCSFQVLVDFAEGETFPRFFPLWNCRCCSWTRWDDTFAALLLLLAVLLLFSSLISNLSKGCDSTFQLNDATDTASCSSTSFTLTWWWDDGCCVLLFAVCCRYVVVWGV